MVGPGLWRENGKKWKMRNKHCRTWNMARNPENRKKKKMRNALCRTWTMVRKM